jgi:hypothetical protein
MSEEQKEFPMEFDHTEAYDMEKGELGTRLNEIFEIAKKHGCPMLFMGITKTEDQVAMFHIQKNDRNGMMPDQMLAALDLVHLPPAQFDLIFKLIDIFQYANTNIEMIQSDIHNAVHRIVEDADSNNDNKTVN